MNKKAVLIVLQQLPGNAEPAQVQANLDHIRTLLGSSKRAGEIYAEIDGRVRVGDIQGAITYLNSVKTYFGLKLGLFIGGFCLLMAAVPIGALLYAWSSVGFSPFAESGEAPPGLEEGQSKMTSVQELAAAFIGHLAEDQIEQAYALMSPAYRSGVPLTTFESVVSKNPYLRNATVASRLRTTSMAGSMKAEGYIRSEAGMVEADFHFSRQGDRWTLVGLTLAGSPALPGFGAGGGPPPEAK
jgi:hypothetical protein